MYQESDLLPISGLQHLAFCERQCALIHLEKAWEENLLTAEGRIMHKRTHEKETESRGDLRIVRGLRLRSFRLGVAGVADVVEFHRCTDHPPGSVSLPGVEGWWRCFPVEYKRGRPKSGRCDEVQLCAQAMCLEEMLGVEVGTGALFYGKTRRRTEVILDEGLRSMTRALAERFHALMEAGVTPRARYEKKCERCSLIDLCMPTLLNRRQSVGDYLVRAREDSARQDLDRAENKPEDLP